MAKPDFTFDLELADVVDPLLFGASEILEGRLYLAGEAEVSPVLHQIDAWIDFRHDSEWNQVIYIPSHVTYVRLPICDGDGERAKIVFPLAHDLILDLIHQGKRVVASCHAGISRSALVVWWVLADYLGDRDQAWLTLKRRRPGVDIHEGFYSFVQSHIRA